MHQWIINVAIVSTPSELRLRKWPHIQVGRSWSPATATFSERLCCPQRPYRLSLHARTFAERRLPSMPPSSVAPPNIYRFLPSLHCLSEVSRNPERRAESNTDPAKNHRFITAELESVRLDQIPLLGAVEAESIRAEAARFAPAAASKVKEKLCA